MSNQAVQEQKTVVLLSGGIDSATSLAIAKREGFQLHALTFDYHQRHRFELESARKIATALNVREHLIFPVDLSLIGGSALTGNIKVPKNRSGEKGLADIPITYVPARNTIFLSIALGWAETIGAHTIYIGANAVDYSGYPDCRPEFISAFETLSNFATKAGVEGTLFSIEAPLIQMTKAEIIKTGVALGVDFSLTSSCYDPDTQGRACGVCDSCRIRKRGFHDAGIPDPTRYVL